MSKGEFLEGLQNALSGEVPSSVVQENLRYYNEYIQTELQKGRGESEVMEELGDPRLIARTIIDTTPGAGDGAYETYNSGSSRRAQTENTRQQEAEDRGKQSVRYYDLSKWYWKLIGIAMIVLVVVLVFTIVGGVLSLVIPMLPAIGIVLLIMWFVRGPRR